MYTIFFFIEAIRLPVIYRSVSIKTIYHIIGLGFFIYSIRNHIFLLLLVFSLHVTQSFSYTFAPS